MALAEYSASTGGYSAGGAFPAVPDRGDSVPGNPVHSWTVDVPVSQLEPVFPSIGTFESIDVTKRNGLGQIGGRVEDVTVVGSQGSLSLSGDQFAADLGLPSAWFQVGGQPPPTVPGATTTTSPPAPPTSPGTTAAGTTVPGTTTTSPAPTPTSTTAPAPVPSGPLGPDDGYWVAGAQGNVAAFGSATFYGTAAGTSLVGQVRAMAATPDYHGYWLAGSKGGVLAFGDASWYGSASKLRLHRRIVGMAATPDGRGYWLVSADGGVFAFGDAGYYGSAGRVHLSKPIVGIAITPDGRGYWLLPATAASSPSATPASTARRRPPTSTGPSWPSCPVTTGAAISWWPGTVGCSPLAMPGSSVPFPAGVSRHRRGRDPDLRRRRLLRAGGQRQGLRVRRCPHASWAGPGHRRPCTGPAVAIVGHRSPRAAPVKAARNRPPRDVDQSRPGPRAAARPRAAGPGPARRPSGP